MEKNAFDGTGNIKYQHKKDNGTAVFLIIIIIVML